MGITNQPKDNLQVTEKTGFTNKTCLDIDLRLITMFRLSLLT